MPPESPARARRRRSDQLLGMALTLPAAALVIGVIAIPIGYLVLTSLTDRHAYLPRSEFVGLDNYLTQLTSGQFWASFQVTTVYAVATVLLQLVVGTVLAMLLHHPFRGRGLVRLLAMGPYMIPAIIVALIWRWLLDPSHGAYNWVVNTINPADPVNMLGPDLIFASLVFVSVWMYAPFVYISVLARLQTVDPSTVEAATMDGAGAWARFRHIYLPEITPVLLTLALLRFMFMFTKFDIVYLFAGTGEEVRTLPLLTYQQIFGEARLGAGSTLSVIMFVLLVLFTTTYLILSKRGRLGDA